MFDVVKLMVISLEALQRLRSAYQDGRLEAVNEAWMEINPDFSLEIDNI